MSKPSYKIISNTASSPVSVQKLRQHLSLWDDSSYDTQLSSLLIAATEYVGNHIGQPVSAVEIEVAFTTTTDLTIKHSKVSGLTVHYYDQNNVLQTLAPANYLVDPTGDYPVVILKTIPVTSNDYQNPIVVRYTTELDPISKSILHAILMTAAELFEVRTESTDAKARIAAITIQRLLAADKVVVV